MKHLFFTLISLLFFSSISAQETMSYNKAYAAENLAKINKLKIDTKDLNAKESNQIKEKLSILFSFSMQDRQHIFSVCIICSMIDGSIKKEEADLLTEIMESKGPSLALYKSFTDFKGSSELFNVIQEAVNDVGLAPPTGPGPTAQGKWGKFWGSVIGAIAGGIGGAEFGPPGIAGGAALGAKIGADIGDAFGDDVVTPSGGNVVARPDGKDCNGFPRS